MLKIVFTILILIVSKLILGQDINLIIQINERLERGSFSNMYATLDSAESQTKYQVDYVPGNLKLPANLLKELKEDSVSVLFIHFTYNTYKKSHQTAHFYASITQPQLKQPYLILNVYDFREKIYRKWYQRNKLQEFTSELIYPSSGILMRNQ